MSRDNKEKKKSKEIEQSRVKSVSNAAAEAQEREAEKTLLEGEGGSDPFVDKLKELEEEMGKTISEIDKGEIKSIRELPENFQHDSAVVARLVERRMDRSILEELSKDAKDDTAFMSRLSRRISSSSPGGSWSTLKFASKRLKGDRDFVSKEIERWPEDFAYASEELRSDPKLALRAMEATKVHRGTDSLLKIIVSLPDALKGDESFILTAIERGCSPGQILRAVPDTLLENIRVVLAVVKRDPGILRFVDLSERMKKLVAEGTQQQSKEQ